MGVRLDTGSNAWENRAKIDKDVKRIDERLSLMSLGGLCTYAQVELCPRLHRTLPEKLNNIKKEEVVSKNKGPMTVITSLSQKCSKTII